MLFVSLEMEPIEVGDRVWSERAGLCGRKMTKDDLDRNENAILSMNIEDMRGDNFQISACLSVTVLPCSVFSQG